MTSSLSAHSIFRDRAEVDHHTVTMLSRDDYDRYWSDDWATCQRSEKIYFDDYYVIAKACIAMGEVNVIVTTGAEPEELLGQEWMSTDTAPGLELYPPLFITTAIADTEGLTLTDLDMSAGRYDVTVRQRWNDEEWDALNHDTDETVWFALTPHQAS